MPKIFDLKEKDWDEDYQAQLQDDLEKGRYSSASLIRNMARLVAKLAKKKKTKKKK